MLPQIPFTWSRKKEFLPHPKMNDIFAESNTNNSNFLFFIKIKTSYMKQRKKNGRLENKKSFFWCYQGISVLHKLMISVFCADTFVHYKNCSGQEENYSDFMWSVLFYCLVYIFLLWKKGVKKKRSKTQDSCLLEISVSAMSLLCKKIHPLYGLG